MISDDLRIHSVNFLHSELLSVKEINPTVYKFRWFIKLNTIKIKKTFFFSRFTEEEVDEMYREAPIKNGMFDYQEFTRILKHGAKEKDEA